MPDLADRLRRFAGLLIDQQRGRIIVPPQRPSVGHWFGGGNLVEDSDGVFWLVGRYRNQGDSRTGLGMGERGLELAIFRSTDRGQSFTKALCFSKAQLNVGDREVLSIEGTALRLSDQGVELYVSSEKSGIGYPAGLESFIKPGTGLWTIDKISAESIEALAGADVEPWLSCSDPRFLHIKDPWIGQHLGQPCVLFCSHPFCWTSSNTGFVGLRPDGSVAESVSYDFFRRGFTWDVAITRATAMLPVKLPGSGQCVDLVFYDGGECVRDLQEHESAVKRPRGYSCEELGGLAYTVDGDLRTIQRLSIVGPSMVSPYGTGCSRYVDVLACEEGYYATWQQSQSDRSQPLVMNFVSRADAESALA